MVCSDFSHKWSKGLGPALSSVPMVGRKEGAQDLLGTSRAQERLQPQMAQGPIETSSYTCYDKV